MADASHPFDARRRRPREWGDAFANLPLETPPLSAWTQIEARLSATAEAATDASAEPSANVVVLSKAGVATAAHQRPARRSLSTRSWLALAASLSALALLPLLWWSNTREVSDPTPIAVAVPKTGAASTVAAVSRDERAPVSLPAEASLERIVPTSKSIASTLAADTGALPFDIRRIALDTAPQRVSATTLVPAPTAPLPMPSETPTNAPSAVSAAPSAVEIASIEPERLPANAVLVGEADADATHREMELLYSASAQLETLLTYARDPHVETGPAAALSSQIHTRLAKIDARLALPGLSTHEQYALWQARVGTLRHAVALESEQRALSAEGQGLEGQLVEVY